MDFELSKRSILSIIFKHQLKMMIVFGTIFVLGLFYALTQTPSYEARGSFLVKFGQGAVPNINSDKSSRPSEFSYNDRTELMQSYINIIQSYDLVDTAIEAVGFDVVFPKDKDADDTKAVAQDKQRKVASFIKGNMEVSIIDRSNIVELSVRHKDAKVAYLLADKILSEFFKRQSEIYNASPVEFLQKQMEGATEMRNKEQAAFRLFKQANSIADIDVEITQLLQEKRELSNISFESAASDQVNLTSLINDLQTKKAELEATYRADSVVMKKINDSLRTARSQLNKVRNGQSISFKGISSTERLKEIDDRISFLEGNREEFDKLQKNLEASEEKERFFKERVEEARVNEALNHQNISRITMVDNPVVPAEPAQGKKKLILAAFILLGLFFAVSLAVISELMDDKISYPMELEKICLVPVIGSFSKAELK